MDMDVLVKLGFAALTGNSALAVYRSRDDAGAVAFVVVSYGAIALLFRYLRRFEREEGDRRRTKAAVWLLTTLLTAMFASGVASLMPAAVALLVWLMAAATAETRAEKHVLDWILPTALQRFNPYHTGGCCSCDVGMRDGRWIYSHGYKTCV